MTTLSIIEVCKPLEMAFGHSEIIRLTISTDGRTFKVLKEHETILGKRIATPKFLWYETEAEARRLVLSETMRLLRKGWDDYPVPLNK